MFLQPFLAYNVGTWTITVQSETTANWKAETTVDGSDQPQLRQALLLRTVPGQLPVAGAGIRGAPADGPFMEGPRGDRDPAAASRSLREVTRYRDCRRHPSPCGNGLTLSPQRLAAANTMARGRPLRVGGYRKGVRSVALALRGRGTDDKTVRSSGVCPGRSPSRPRAAGRGSGLNDGSEKGTSMLRVSLSIILLAGWTVATPVARSAANDQIQTLTIKGSVAYEAGAALRPAAARSSSCAICRRSQTPRRSSISGSISRASSRQCRSSSPWNATNSSGARRTSCAAPSSPRRARSGAQTTSRLTSPSPPWT